MESFCPFEMVNGTFRQAVIDKVRRLMSIMKQAIVMLGGSGEIRIYDQRIKRVFNSFEW